MRHFGISIDTGNRGQIDNAPPAPLNHLGQNRLGNVHRTHHIHIQILLPFFNRCLQEGRPAAPEGSVVHEDIHATKSLRGSFHAVIHGRGIRHIANNSHYLVGSRFYFRFRSRKSFCIHIHHHHISAISRQLDGCCLTDAYSGTGDDGGLSCKIHI